MAKASARWPTCVPSAVSPLVPVSSGWKNAYLLAFNPTFSPANIPAGGVSTLTVNIYNPNTFPLTLSSIPAAWTDTLPVGVSFANPAEPTTTCGGSVSMAGGTLSLIGGTVPEQTGDTPGTCKVTVKVTSIVPGNHDNIISANNLRATDPTGTIQITNTSPATHTLQVLSIQPPALSKLFVPNTQWVGISSQLRISIRNNDLNNPLTEVSVADSLPANIVLANTTVAYSSCGGSAVLRGQAASRLPLDRLLLCCKMRRSQQTQPVSRQ